MPLSAEVDEFVKAASASLPRVSEIIAALPDEDRAGAFEFAERRYAQAACTGGGSGGCERQQLARTISTPMRRAACQRPRDPAGTVS